MKKLVILLTVVLLLGGAAGGYFLTQSRGSQGRYRLVRVERGPLTAAVSATGNVNAVITVQVGSQVSGQIKELLADFNSVVKRDQIIARIDPELFEAKVSQARADVESARATVLNQQAQVERARADVENARAALAEARALTAKAQFTAVDAKRDVDRKSELFRRDLIAKSDLDTSQANYDAGVAQVDSSKAKEGSLEAGIKSAEAQLRVNTAMLQSSQAQVKQKEAALQQALVDLEHTTIRAPVDGVVVSRAVDVGQTVAASLQAPTLFTIAQDLTKMQVETSVDEADIGRIKLDDSVTFTVDAFPGETFPGRVVQIRKAAVVVQNVVTYTVVVAVDNAGSRLLPGMTANVKVVVAQKPSVLKVANAALRFRPPGTDAPAGGPRVADSTGGRGAPATGPGTGGGEQMRERLVRGLDLTDEQQRRLDPILADTRKEMAAARALPEAERPARIKEVRETARARIREILTPEQQKRYDQFVAGERSTGGTPGRVWTLGPDGKPQAVSVVLGLSDGSATEVLQGDLSEGQEIIAGLAGAGSQPQRPGAGSAPRLRL
ncbi:MAG TPA: efflux RND transporter periplasmic adaptor subunit [Methylomirabilota bacterium]|jgi:HlyD family secretion protein